MTCHFEASFLDSCLAHATGKYGALNIKRRTNMLLGCPALADHRSLLLCVVSSPPTRWRLLHDKKQSEVYKTITACLQGIQLTICHHTVTRDYPNAGSQRWESILSYDSRS